MRRIKKAKDKNKNKVVPQWDGPNEGNRNTNQQDDNEELLN